MQSFVNGWFGNPQVQFLNRLMKVDDPEFGTFQLVRNGVNFSETPAVLNCRPPKLGEHNEATLRKLGYNDGDIQTLRKQKVI